jgi:hypothetical protein
VVVAGRAEFCRYGPCYGVGRMVGEKRGKGAASVDGLLLSARPLPGGEACAGGGDCATQRLGLVPGGLLPR